MKYRVVTNSEECVHSFQDIKDFRFQTNTHTHARMYIYIYIYVCVCVCVCLCRAPNVPSPSHLTSAAGLLRQSVDSQIRPRPYSYYWINSLVRRSLRVVVRLMVGRPTICHRQRRPNGGLYVDLYGSTITAWREYRRTRICIQKSLITSVYIRDGVSLPRTLALPTSFIKSLAVLQQARTVNNVLRTVAKVDEWVFKYWISE